VQQSLRRWNNVDSFNTGAREGRRAALTRRDRRTLLRTVNKYRRISRRDLVKSLRVPVSHSTVKRALRAANLRKWKALKRIRLTEEVARDRYAFAKYWSNHIEDLLRVGEAIPDPPLFPANGLDNLHR
jgi:hypothetical protein